MQHTKYRCRAPCSAADLALKAIGHGDDRQGRRSQMARGQGERAMSDQVIAAAGAVKATRVRWKIFLLMLFLVSVNYIDRDSLSVAMPLISKEFDIEIG